MVVARLKYPEPRSWSAERRLQIVRRYEYLMARLKDHGWRN